MTPLSVEDITDEINKIVSIDVDSFNKIAHALYNTNITWKTVHWRNRPLNKWPSDLWVYIELIQWCRPQVIVETGTFHGGSAVFFADMQRLFGIGGMVITIDIEQEKAVMPPLPILSIRGDSTSPEVLAEVERWTRGAPSVLVSLDSDHSYGHVLNELIAYSKFVPLGGCIVVEDTNVEQMSGKDGDPVEGPGRAVKEFLESNTGKWARNVGCERFVFGHNSGGWLVRTA